MTVIIIIIITIIIIIIIIIIMMWFSFDNHNLLYKYNDDFKHNIQLQILSQLETSPWLLK